MYAPEDHQRFLGKTFVSRLGEVALQIGKDTWTRHQLANDLGCGNYRAAALVTRAMRQLEVKDLKEVFTYDPGSLASVHQLGETGMWVLLRALEHRGFDPKAWYGGDSKEADRTFRTLKIHAQKREADERKERRKKRHSR